MRTALAIVPLPFLGTFGRLSQVVDLDQAQELRRFRQDLARKAVEAITQGQDQAGSSELSRSGDRSSVGSNTSGSGAVSPEVCGKGSDTPVVAFTHRPVRAMSMSLSCFSTDSRSVGTGSPLSGSSKFQLIRLCAIFSTEWITSSMDSPSAPLLVSSSHMPKFIGTSSASSPYHSESSGMMTVCVRFLGRNPMAACLS